MKKEILKELNLTLDDLHNTPCSFWACKGTPENNRVESMVTCSRCAAIIHLVRAIKMIEKLP